MQLKFLSLLMQIGPGIFIFLEILEPLLLKFVIMDRSYDAYKMVFEPKVDTFDFIIVGAGSSGSHLASRLSEKYSVLLLEAGGSSHPLLQIPTLNYILNNQKPVDYAHRTVPQTMAAWGLNNNVSHWPAGKQLGGSSTINGLIYIRGNVQGFDEIAKKTGDARWSMDNVLNYYKRIEDYDGWFDHQTLHGKTGRMSIERGEMRPFTTHLLEAAVELGYKVRDPNLGRNSEGFAPTDFYMKFGRRVDAYKSSLLNKMSHRRNLVIKKFAHVTKLIIEGDTVIGVRYIRHNQMLEAYAAKEVILSAGAIQTPKILMLSGIGPSGHLQDMGIKVRMNLPVGQSLQDKYGALMGPFIVKDGYSFVRERDINIPSLLRWFFTGKGPMSSGRTEAIYSKISNYSKSHGNTDVPDIHTYVISSSTDARAEHDYGRSFNFNPSSLEYFRQAQGKDSFLQLVTVSKPKGFGYVKLANSNYQSPMIIDPKYLQNSDDVRTLIDGMKFAVQLVDETNAMRSIHAHLMHVPFPGCEIHLFKSDAYYECLARHSTITAYKYCGTAPIGKDIREPGAVVDSHLRVFNLRNLRIADASVLQMKYISVNDVTARMLGELASDIILNDYDRSKSFS